MILTEIAKQLREVGLSAYYAHFFRVTSEPPESLHLFDRPVWYFPDDYQPYRLFVDKI